MAPEPRLKPRLRVFCEDFLGNLFKRQKWHQLDETKRVPSSVNLYSSISRQLSLQSSHGPAIRSRWKRFLLFWKQQQVWLFLILLGLTSALGAVAIDKVIHLAFTVRAQWTQLTDIWIIQFFQFILFSMIFGLFSACCVRYISVDAAGSGIPQMKCILSGMIIPNLLSVRTLVAKVFGLVCTFASGLSIGKEGPYVHISSIIANQLARIPGFERINSVCGWVFVWALLIF
eukprot:GCRY01005365.1.p1 GENE.GCRY01005365.1~~GCRY01005365.1.p1  ORF type:complete len:230 (+),score=23.99 GCRY01005365.1:223-912(+)